MTPNQPWIETASALNQAWIGPGVVLGPGSALGLQSLVLIFRPVGLNLNALSTVLCFWSLLFGPWSAIIGLGLGPMTLVIGRR